MVRLVLDRIRRFAANEHGVSLVEYSVMLMMIVLGSVVLIKSIGAITNGAFQELSSNSFTSRTL